MVKLRKLQRGFTLIELLIVIAILAVLAAAVIAAIDPVDKINAANDSKVQSDIAEIATAEESYAVNHDGSYAPGANAAAVQTALNASGDLKHTFNPPTNYCSGTYVLGTNGGGVSWSCDLKSKKYTNDANTDKYWTWCSSTGNAGPRPNNTTCP